MRLARGRSALLLLVAASLLLGACSEDAPDLETTYAPPTRPAPPGPPVPPRVAGTDRVFGQEIWVGYHDPEREPGSLRSTRTREEARAIAERLRRLVLAGEDIGPLARRHSNAVGGTADGWAGPVDPTFVTYPWLASVAVGEVTPLVELKGGWWFARRVDEERHRELEQLFERRGRERISVRAIAILYKGAAVASPVVAERITWSKEDAIALAEQLLARILAGEDFEDVAREKSHDDESRPRGGLIAFPDAEGNLDPWLRLQDPRVPGAVLAAADETPAGSVHLGVVVSERGVFLVKTEGRRWE